jgi:transposase
MSLHPEALPPVPESTAALAHKVFRKGNRYMTIRDELGVFYNDQDFAALYPTRGQAGETPWRLALVLVFQYMEGLSDRDAADAVRGRIDWKYALSLELSDPGFDASVLSEFRSRLVAGGQEQLLLDAMLKHLVSVGVLKARGRQRSDSTHVLAAVRALNRYACVGETLRHCLNVLATVAPDWLRARLQPEWVQPEWVQRYADRFDDYSQPAGVSKRLALVQEIGADGRTLLDAVHSPDAPAWLRQVPAVETLRLVWLQQYYAVAPDAPMQWRANEDQPPASQLLHTPYDAEARYGTKGDLHWVGYKVHLTESCEPDKPHLITNVLTTVATGSDFAAAAVIHQQLAEKELLPQVHLLDAGYIDAELLVSSARDYAIGVIGPIREEHTWQAREQTGYHLTAFQLDWEARRATCPQGNVSTKWSATKDALGTPIINIRFGAVQCRTCSVRQLCTRSATEPRNITVRPQPVHEALQAARQHQHTADFHTRYKLRAGIEGTLSQGIRRSDLRRTRYTGLAKTRLQHIVTAAALNLRRIADWLGDQPLATTRTPAFVRLAATA